MRRFLAHVRFNLASFVSCSLLNFLENEKNTFYHVWVTDPIDGFDRFDFEFNVCFSPYYYFNYRLISSEISLDFFQIHGT